VIELARSKCERGRDCSFDDVERRSYQVVLDKIDKVLPPPRAAGPQSGNESPAQPRVSPSQNQEGSQTTKTSNWWNVPVMMIGRGSLVIGFIAILVGVVLGLLIAAAWCRSTVNGVSRDAGGVISLAGCPCSAGSMVGFLSRKRPLRLSQMSARHRASACVSHWFSQPCDVAAPFGAASFHATARRISEPP
jgi:hypothetical protein